ncbi:MULTISPECIES: hypothetical protein [Amycolatopsis]|uniref:hypothetical protein n=1 Tax=Amycolatopsis TaxID=1813 RepID=UPI000B8AFF49|nr:MULTISPECIES: hypothetical protein [Amycolatopsis]OXM73087.1 hypothetical protein CF166_11230 [Amycolatopsis sp. KNN50.9b]
MARTSVATQPIVKTGVAPVLTAPVADGDIIDTGRVFLQVTNGGGSPVTVTVQATVEVDGLDLEDLVVSVPAAGTRLIGPLSRATFGQLTGSADVGRAYVDYSSVTDVTRGVFTL